MLKQATRLQRQSLTALTYCPACRAASSSRPNSVLGPSNSAPRSTLAAAHHAASRASQPVASTSYRTLDGPKRFHSVRAAPELEDEPEDEQLASEFNLRQRVDEQAQEAEAVPDAEELLLQTQTAAKDQPSIADLDARLPRNIKVPSASTPPSAKLVYKKKWDQARKSLVGAFNKPQLRRFIKKSPEKGGLGLALDDPALLIGFPRKGWKAKALSALSSNELAIVIMTLHWKLIHPENVPRLKSESTITKTVPLSDRDAFLLLSVKSSASADLEARLGVSLTFARDTTNGTAVVVLQGSAADIAQAEVELGDMVSSVMSRDLELLGPITDVAPEIYQAISVNDTAYLEPVDDQTNKLKLLKIKRPSASLDWAESRLHQAFVRHHERKNVPYHLSSRVDDTQRRLFPWSTTRKPSLPVVAPAWGRYKAEHSMAEVADTDPAQTIVRSLSASSTAPEASLAQSVMRDLDLERPFPVRKHQRSSLRASFGQVLWPVSPTNQQDISKRFESFDSLSEWIRNGMRNESNVSYFETGVPAGFFKEVGLTEPVQAKPFFPWLGRTADASSDLGKDASASVRMTQKTIRRLVYKPIKLESPSSDSPLPSLVIETDEVSGSDSTWYETTERQTELLVPDGPVDVRFERVDESKRRVVFLPFMRSVLSRPSAVAQGSPTTTASSSSHTVGTSSNKPGGLSAMAPNQLSLITANSSLSSKADLRRQQGATPAAAATALRYERVVGILDAHKLPKNSSLAAAADKRERLFLDSDRIVRTVSFEFRQRDDDGDGRTGDNDEQGEQEIDLGLEKDKQSRRRKRTKSKKAIVSAAGSADQGKPDDQQSSSSPQAIRWTYEMSDSTFEKGRALRQCASLELPLGRDTVDQVENMIKQAERLARKPHEPIPTSNFRM